MVGWIMPLTPKEPIVEGTTYDQYWLDNCNIMANEVGGKANVMITLKAYNSQTGEVSPPNFWKTMVLDDVLSRIQGGDTLLAQAYGAILAVIQREVNRG
jgi:hypothetical protein